MTRSTDSLSPYVERGEELFHALVFRPEITGQLVNTLDWAHPLRGGEHSYLGWVRRVNVRRCYRRSLRGGRGDNVLGARAIWPLLSASVLGSQGASPISDG